MATTLAQALELVGINSENVQEKMARVRSQAEEWVEAAPAPEVLKDFVAHFLRATTDVNIPLRDLAVLVGAAAYVILPLDFIPDFLPLLGWSDDIALVGLAVETLKGHWRKHALPRQESSGGKRPALVDVNQPASTSSPD